MRIAFLFVLIFISTNVFSQKKKVDLWTGRYSVHPNNDDVAQDTLVISRSKDLKPENVPAKLEADLSRWAVGSKRDAKKDEILVRRFLQNEEDDEYVPYSPPSSSSEAVAELLLKMTTVMLNVAQR